MAAEARATIARRQLLCWTAGVGAVTAEALAVREGSSLASARGRLTAAARCGQLRRSAPLCGQPALFTVTRDGLRACGANGVVPARVGAAGAVHAIVCASVAAALDASYPDHAVIGVPELRRLERSRSSPLASVRLRAAPGETPALHRPDLVLLPRAGNPSEAIAVEVELTVKAPLRLEQICRAWARSREPAGVLYVVAPAVEPALRRALRSVYAAERVAVVPLASLLA